MLVCHGKYSEHEKSNNSSYQQKSYSRNKYYHLLKPFTICTINGFIVDILGPYAGDKNDATILRQSLEEHSIQLALYSPSRGLSCVRHTRKTSQVSSANFDGL